MVRFRLAADAAFFMFFLAALLCLVEAIGYTPLTGTLCREEPTESACRLCRRLHVHSRGDSGKKFVGFFLFRLDAFENGSIR
jgi:hypothetical protein